MAVNTLATVQQAFQTQFDPVLTNQINRAVVLARFLGFRPADGKNITWDVRLGDSPDYTTAAINDGADVTTFNSDTKVPATLNYGTYHDAFGLSGKALAGAMASQQPQALVDLFAEELGESIERLANVIGKEFYLGDGSTNRIHGLLDGTVAAIGDTGTYAGLSRGTYAQWKGNVVDAQGADVSFDALRNLRRTIYVASGEMFDLLVGDPVQHEKYGQLFGPQRRYLQEVRLAGRAPITLDGGYQVLEFDGIPFIQDVQCPPGVILALNTRRITPRQLLSVTNPAITGMTGGILLGGTPEEQLGPGRFNMTAYLLPLAKTGDMHKFAIYVYPQNQVRRPNTCGYLTNLGTAV